MNYQAIVLRTRPYRDADLIVDLLVAELGRVSAIARSGRSSKRRFTGAMETGARLQVTLTRRGRSQLYTLSGCDIVRVPMEARQNLARFYQLAYVIELIDTLTVEGQAEEANYQALWLYLARLEIETPSHAALVQWELLVLAQNGYHYQFWPCAVTGGAADGFSMEQGRALDSRVAEGRGILKVSSDTLQCVERMRLGTFQGCDDHRHEEIRSLINKIWVWTVERRLKSVAFIGPESFAEDVVSEAETGVTSVDLHSDISQARYALKDTTPRQ